MQKFKGIRSGSSRSNDTLEIASDNGNIIVGVISPEYRADAALSLTPAVARKAAAELIRLADEIEKAKT